MFLGFALLDQAVFDKKQLLQNLQEDWGMNFVMEDDGEESEADKNIFFIQIGETRLAVSLFNMAVPNGESAMRARRNLQWEDAVTVATNHKAHLLVSSMGQDPIVDEAKLFVNLMASVAKLPHVMGLDVAGTVLEPSFYVNMARYYHEADTLPLYNLVYFGVYGSADNTISAYTIGMTYFGKPEMEVIKSKQSVSEVHELLFMLANHVINNDIILQDLDEIPITETDKIVISRSQGIALNAETVKVSF